MINFAPFISLLLRKNPHPTTERILTDRAKSEIEKINKMEFFDAVDYLTNKEEEKITYCGACGGDASICDGC
jgi:hypothetical protein